MRFVLEFLVAHGEIGRNAVESCWDGRRPSPGTLPHPLCPYDIDVSAVSEMKEVRLGEGIRPSR